MEQCSQRPSKKQKVYQLCKNTVALVITLVALVPIVYLLGSDDAIYPSRPLFAAYAEETYFQAKVAEIQTALNSSLIVNLHWQGEKKENSVREWQHLQEFVRFLGHRLNNQQITTVNRLIVPPEVKPQKKGKNAPSAENVRLIEQAYSLANSGEMNTIRNKLNKIALNTINRLKIKQKDTKNAGLAEVLRGSIIDEVLAPKVWIITIHPDNWQNHNSEQFKKQLSALSKEREKDRFVVVSTAPADTEWKRMKAIPINIDEGIFSNLKGKIKQAIKAAFPFEVNATRVIESVLCHHESSLYHLNNFLQNCNTTQSCVNSIKFLSKKSKKGEDVQAMQLLNQLCNIGHIDQENVEFQAVLDSLGFFDDYQKAEENIKLYFGVATGKKCKGVKQCNFEWLNSKPITPKAPKSQKASSQKPQKQTPKKDASKQKLPTKQKNELKTKTQKQLKKQVLKQTTKVNKVKQVKGGKSKQNEKKVKQQKSQKQGQKTLYEQIIQGKQKQPKTSTTIPQEATVQTTQTQIVQQASEETKSEDEVANISTKVEPSAESTEDVEEALPLPTEDESSTALIAAEAQAESQCEKKDDCEVAEPQETQMQPASPQILQTPKIDPVEDQLQQTLIIQNDGASDQANDDNNTDEVEAAEIEAIEEGSDPTKLEDISQIDDAVFVAQGKSTIHTAVQAQEQQAEPPQTPTDSIPSQTELTPPTSQETAPEQA